MSTPQPLDSSPGAVSGASHATPDHSVHAGTRVVSKRPSKAKALARLPLYVIAGLTLPFRRKRTATGISPDADDRKAQMLALTAGVARTVGTARLRSTLRRKKRRAELRQAALERATRDAVEQLGSMKGVSMKLGQMMSYMSVLSDDGESQLSELQASVPPMAPELVTAVVEEQLGAVPERLFAEFEMTPIAAASVGQVHRARVHDGRGVVIKVQYPGVAEAFRADLANLESLLAMTALSMKADPTAYYTMIADSLMGELDYSLEQRNQQRLANMYRGHPFVQVPDTVPELSTPMVLVSEYIGARRFQEVVTASQEERDRFGEIMYRFAFGCIMNSFFSGDPHPGNYLFPTDGRVCFLDFGMVIELTSPAHVGRISQVIAGALQGRQDLIDDGLRILGFLPNKGPTGAEVWDELKGLVVGPVDEDAVICLDRDAFRAGIKKMMSPTSKFNRAVAKTESWEGWAAVWMRYAAGALSSISKLAPRANWRHILEEIVLGEAPRTEIGRQWGPAPGGAEFAGSRYKS